MTTTCVNSNERVHDVNNRVSSVHALSANIHSFFKGLGKMLVSWQRRVEYRHHLLELDERLLRDVGLSRYDALKEAAKPFWKD